VRHVTDFDVVLAALTGPKNRAVRAGLELLGLRQEGSEFPVDLTALDLSASWIDTEDGLVSQRCAK